MNPKAYFLGAELYKSGISLTTLLSIARCYARTHAAMASKQESLTNAVLRGYEEQAEAERGIV